MDLSNKFLQFLHLIRFFNPTGYILLFIPCALGVGLYGNIYEDYSLLALYFLGAFVMRSAGCIINDLWDRDIDQKVSRTNTRPIASGQISSREAAILFTILSLIGLVILLQLSREAILIGFVAALMVMIYPLMKRITYLPQLFLGFTYNIGVLIAVLDRVHEVTFESILLYIGCVFWTLYYDTIYAFMDIEDDKKIGVKSMAILLEKKDYRLYLVAFAGIAMFLITNGLVIGKNNFSILSLSVLASIMFVMWQITTLKINLTENCLIRFKSNIYLGIIWMFAALI